MMGSATRIPVRFVLGRGHAANSSAPRLLIAGIICAWLTSCGSPTAPEEAVRSWVQQGQDAAEEKNRRALVAMISPAYADTRGNSRDEIENMIRWYFLRQNQVALFTRIEELRVVGDSAADLVLAVGMTGTNDSALGLSADAYRFEMELERDGDDWLLIAARWGDIGGDLR